MKNKLLFISVLVTAMLSLAGNRAAAAMLRFAYASVAPPLSGVWAAQETGAFKKYGLEVQLIYISSSAINAQALLGGSLEVATPGGTSAVLLAARGAPIVAIGSVMNRPPMTLYVQPEISRLEQLKGQAIGITRFGSTGHAVSTLMLRNMGMTQAVTLRPVGGNPELQAAFEQKIIAGFVTTVKPKAAARPLANAIDLDVPYAMNLITVTQDFLKQSTGNFIEENLRGLEPDVAILAENSNYDWTEAIKILRPKTVIVHHYDDWHVPLSSGMTAAVS